MNKTSTTIDDVLELVSYKLGSFEVDVFDYSLPVEMKITFKDGSYAHVSGKNFQEAVDLLWEEVS